MKRFLSALLTLALLLALLPAQCLAADDKVILDGVIYDVGLRYYTVVGYTEDLPADVVLPDTIDEGIVSDIAENAFRDCKLIRSIKLPSRLTSIGKNAFYGSTLGGIVDLPPTAFSIRDYAFNGCNIVGVRYSGRVTNYTLSDKHLVIICPREYMPEPFKFSGCAAYFAEEELNPEYLQSFRYTQDGIDYVVCESFAAVLEGKNEAEVVVPDRVIGVPVTQILAQSFQSCHDLRTLTLPQTVESIGYSAFNGTDLRSFTAPKALKTIGDHAFSSDVRLKDVDLTGVEVIEDWAFYQCVQLASVELGSSVTSIGKDAFCMCPKLSSITLPLGLKSLGNYAFAWDEALTELRLPNSLEMLGSGVFASTPIASLTIPGTISTLPEHAFYDMPELTTVVFREGLQSIGASAFYGCPKLQSIALPASVELVSGVPDMYGGTVYYHTGTHFDVEQATNNRICFQNLDTGERREMFYTYRQDNLDYLICEDHVKVTGRGPESVTELVIPEEVLGLPVTEIGKYALSFKTLVHVTLPSTLTTIGEFAFYDCPWLCGVSLPASVTHCGNDEEELPIFYLQRIGVERYAAGYNFYILAEEGTYAAEYAERLGYKTYISDDTRRYELVDNHVFVMEDGEAALAASHPHYDGDTDVVPGYVDGLPVTRVLSDAYANPQRAGHYSAILWNEPLAVVEDQVIWEYPLSTVFVVPATVTSIGAYAFGGRGYTIYGTVGSYAQEYAEENGLTFLDASDLLPFEDIDRSAWYYPAVKYCYWNGLMNGTSSTAFSPKKTTTRAMIVQVFFNIAGDPNDAGAEHFEDVPSGAWYAQAVNWAYENGVTSGTSATAFSPNNPVTREQVATFLYNFANAMGMDTSARADLSGYQDAEKVSGWAMDAMQWCVAEGLITGTDKTTLSPKNSATRAQIATIIMRFFGGE